jgi:hypothetical protein
MPHVLLRVRLGDQDLQDSPQPIRVLRIRMPNQETRMLLAFALAIGSILAWILICLYSLYLAQLLITSALLPNTLEYAIPVCLAFMGVGLLFIGFFSWDRRQQYKSRILRRTRLERMTADPRAFVRFPHRHLELLYHHRKVRWKAIRSLLARMPARTVVLVDCPTKSRNFPVATQFFEPIDILEDMGSLFGILNGTIDFHGNSDTDSSGSTSRIVSRIIAVVLSILFVNFMIWAAYKFYLFAIGNGTTGAWLSAMMLCFFLGFVVWLILRQRNWYLIPGGLVRVEQKLWKKQSDVILSCPDSSPLLLYFAEDQGFVVASSEILEFYFDEMEGLAILSGWLSTARRPSLEEITAFVEGRTKAG